MKNSSKKIDWLQIGVFALGLATAIVKSLYETKRFNDDLNTKYENNFDKRVNELIDKKMNKNK